jgi:hypothetical protein
VRSPAIGGEASGSFESLADSVPGDGATGVLRDVSAFDSGAASASAPPADSDLSTSGIVVTDRVAATPPPPRVRPDPAAVAGARASQPAPTEFASAAAPTATELAPGPAPLAVPVAATPRAGTDGLIADVERILAEGHPADMPAMDALPPADLADAPAMDALSHDNPFDPVQTGATALPRPGTAFPPPPAGGSTTVEIYGPPSPYPAYPAPAYPSAGGAFGTPSPLAGKPLYIPPAPGGPVPPGEIPANGPSSTSIF